MKKILLIDDSSFSCSVLAELLESEGFEVVVSHEGTTGLKLARKEKLDAILCDMVMPGLTGGEVLRIVRCSPSISHIPFILISGIVPQEDADHLKWLGANGFISKEWSSAQIARVIRNLIQPQLTNSEKMLLGFDRVGCFHF